MNKELLNDVSTDLAGGDPEAALKKLKDVVRSHPSDCELRLTLAQLEMINGHWDKAAAAADAAGTMDVDRALLCQQWRLQIQAEETRAEVFAGKTTAFVMGDPEPWIAGLQEALRLDGEGHAEAATEARRKALDSAPAIPGSIDGQAFEWLCDADERIGPCFEAVINGRYTWVPQAVVTSLTTRPPADLLDMVWTEVVMKLQNGGETAAMMPVRYPDSHSDPEGKIRLSRMTSFGETPGGTRTGLGQRLFATDVEDHAQLETREIQFHA